MALDRRLTAYPSLRAATSRTGGAALWARRQLRSELISTGQTGFYDVDNLVARESVIFRMRTRPITLRTVLVSEDGMVWLLESIAEVGRRRYLDVAATSYQGVSARDDLTRWPVTTDPYTAQADWGLVDSDGNPVQNVSIRRWGINPDGDSLSPRLEEPDQENRAGFYWTVAILVNAGYSGTVPLATSTITGDLVPSTNSVEIETQNGTRGRMSIDAVAELQRDNVRNIQATDGWIPVASAFRMTFSGLTNPGLRIGSVVRVLSTQEISNG